MLTEVRNTCELYYVDAHGLYQNEYKLWYASGEQHIDAYHKDSELHGEYKEWHDNGQMFEHSTHNDGKLHGEYKEWFRNGQMYKHCFYVDGNRHGEYKKWYEGGQMLMHMFYLFGDIVTNEVKAVVQDIENITDEEKLLIKLTWGIECLP